MTTAAKQGPLTLHPFMLGVISLLICCRDVAPYVKALELAILFGGFAAVVSLVHLIGNHIFSSRLKGGIAATITVLIFCFAAECRTFVEWALAEVSEIDYVNGVYVLIGLLLVWILALALLFRCKTDFPKLTRFLNVMSVAVGAATLFEVYTFTAPRELPPLPERSYAPLKLPVNPPDIYYIVMDAYTSAESLQTYWGYDNSPFVSFLSDKGFHVVENAKANYDLTPLCMATSLGMDYPATIPDSGFMPKMNYLTELLRNAEVPARLKASGYQIVNYSLFDVAGEKRFYRYPMIEPIYIGRRAYTKSLLGLLADVERIGFRNVNQEILSALPKVAAQRAKSPRFIYAHPMMPHCPYLFDEHGNHVVRGLHNNDQKKEDYLEYLIFANKMLTNTISGILNNSERPPIIILQGDHGFRLLEGPGRAAECLTILNSYYLPGAPAGSVYEGITPVNSFRMIFNHYFSEDYTYAPDIGKSVNPMGKMQH